MRTESFITENFFMRCQPWGPSLINTDPYGVTCLCRPGGETRRGVLEGLDDYVFLSLNLYLLEALPILS